MARRSVSSPRFGASGHLPGHRAAFDRGRSYPSLAGHAGERGERAMTGRYRFTHVWTLVLVGVGLAILSIGVLSAALLLLVPTEIPVPAPWPRLLVAAAAVVGGLVIAAPLILTGQLVQIFLDQRRLLGRIHRRLRRWEDERESERTSPMRGPRRPP
jgi:hypothetical protein